MRAPFLPRMLTLAAVVCTAAGALALPGGALRAREPRTQNLPKLMLWAWDRPVELLDLDSAIGVAFLAQTIDLRKQGLDVRPRRHPLLVSSHTPLMAVTRIEAPAGAPPATDAGAVEAVAALVVKTSSLPRVAGLQIDFDATASQRGFYRALIARVRVLADPATPLSMTALASWCSGDPWLDAAAVDEVVPMLFRMGGAAQAFGGIAASDDQARPECRRALGTSLDEPMAIKTGGRRIYVFNPEPWTPETVAAVRRLAGETWR
jgi:hypothetical protein